jgi:hypothetical protein
METVKIDFFDCADDIDMQRSSEILKSKEVIKKEVVTFPYLMLVWKDTK